MADTNKKLIKTNNFHRVFILRRDDVIEIFNESIKKNYYPYDGVSQVM
jgi:hypothetical protein